LSAVGIHDAHINRKVLVTSMCIGTGMGAAGVFTAE
jgi:hypothetical protein